MASCLAAVLIRFKVSDDSFCQEFAFEGLGCKPRVGMVGAITGAFVIEMCIALYIRSVEARLEEGDNDRHNYRCLLKWHWAYLQVCCHTLQQPCRWEVVVMLFLIGQVTRS